MRLSTGREIDANRGLISVDGDGNLYEGYDGELHTLASDYDVVNLAQELTPAERAELADAMIERWARFKTAPHPLAPAIS